MKVLHINASPRGDNSSTAMLASEFLAKLKVQHDNLEVQSLHLFDESLPALTGPNLDSKYMLMRGLALDSEHQTAWQPVQELVNDFLSADLYLISAPMWNFSIPYMLKYYIDTIVQPGYLFRYNEQGIPEGLVHGKRMVCLTSRGGDYSAESPFNAYDFQEPYLRAIFGFVGIYDIEFVNAQPLDMGPDSRSLALDTAGSRISELANKY